MQSFVNREAQGPGGGLGGEDILSSMPGMHTVEKAEYLAGCPLTSKHVCTRSHRFALSPCSHPPTHTQMREQERKGRGEGQLGLLSSVRQD